jgi:hypothetical protein
MKKQVAQLEIDEAAHATIGFISTAFMEKKFGGPEFQFFHNEMSRFVQLEPIPNARKINGRTIDFYAPSFWHACCKILYEWAISRFNDDESKAKILAYRGQSNPWPFCPTLWRSNYRSYGNSPAEAIRKYLSPGDKNQDVSFNFFPGYSSLDGLTAFAQHHEFPTRFLDFTFHPLVALFFSVGDSKQADLPNNSMNGHGMIFQTYFSNFFWLANRTPLKLELGMMPPMHVPRLYQQQGFFVDCGDDSNKKHLPELEIIFQRIYFPREYPIVNADIKEVISEDVMMTALGNETDIYAPQLLEEIGSTWYSAFEWYQQAIKALKEYCNSKPTSFDIDTAVRLMKESNGKDALPWSGNYSNFGMASNRFGIEAAPHLARAALQICNIATVYGTQSYFMDETVTLAYARANRSLFEAIIEISKKVQLHNIHHYAQELESVNNLMQEISGSLTKGEREFIDRTVSARHDGPNRIVFGDF